MSERRSEVEKALCETISKALAADIRKVGSASLLVSGGSTPKALFEQLSKESIAWEKVTIMPVDERFVADEHPDQNGTMIKKHLLQAKAASANFIPMVINPEDPIDNLKKVSSASKMINRPFTVVLLGMGTDGHTASLFPDAVELDEAMDLTTEEELMNTATNSANHPRITYTRAALLDSKKLCLHFYGDEKKQVLEKAYKTENYRPYPIAGFLHQEKVEMKIFWTN